MATDTEIPDLPLADKWTLTKDALGRRYQLEPGTRIVLERYDQWMPHDGERLLEQLSRVSTSEKELRRRERARKRLRTRRLASELYKIKDEQGGDDYWSALQASSVLAD